MSQSAKPLVMTSGKQPNESRIFLPLLASVLVAGAPKVAPRFRIAALGNPSLKLGILDGAWDETNDDT
jgi:hypothetical protein